MEFSHFYSRKYISAHTSMRHQQDENEMVPDPACVFYFLTSQNCSWFYPKPYLKEYQKWTYGELQGSIAI